VRTANQDGSFSKLRRPHRGESASRGRARPCRFDDSGGFLPHQPRRLFGPWFAHNQGMPRITFAILAVLVGAAVVTIFVMSPVLASGTVACAALGWLVIAMTRCRHPHPALQPPLVGDDGQRQPPHWYCDDCGRRWVAHFDHDRQPVVRFAGFDPTKAVDAARRADELEARRREMAVVRSGLVGRRPTVASGPMSLDEHRELRSAR